MREPPDDGMVISQHVAEKTLKKAMIMQLFLRLMNFWDSAENADVGSRTHTEELAIKAGLYISVSKAFVYRCYKEWRYGQEERAMEAQVKKSIVVDSRG